MTRASRFAICVCVALLGCAPPREPTVIDGPIAAPARADVGEDCHDVGDARACWGERCPHGCAVPRPATNRSPVGGLRCSGAGEKRSCVARGRAAGAFTCAGDVCRQPYPRVPDTGEWECVDLHGASLCRSLADAAGIPRGPRDPAFSCGVRRGKGEPLCIDLAPDLPDASGAYSCSTRLVRGLPERHCTRVKTPVLGARCRAAGDCPAGARCVTGLCLPPSLHPDCWFDADCDRGQHCRLGSCT